MQILMFPETINWLIKLENFVVYMNAINVLEKDSAKKISILVVDDDVLNQRMMQLLLNREGYQVTTASNGVDAVEMVKNRDFDVILMDLQMPVLDGTGASRQIREWENGKKHTFIIALTASFLPEKGHELYEAGIDNYISKPFDLEHLKQILRYSHNEGREFSETAVDNDFSGRSFSFDLGVHRVGGSKEIFKELLRDFIEELPGKLEKIDACHRDNQYELLSRLAHNLKGVSANLGAMRLSEQAGKLEKQVDTHVTGSEIKNIIETVRVAADEFQKSASKYLSE